MMGDCPEALCEFRDGIRALSSGRLGPTSATVALPSKMRFLPCSFESWVGQESKLLAAGYISTKAGGPKKAIFDKEAQNKIGKVQEVGHLACTHSSASSVRKFSIQPIRWSLRCAWCLGAFLRSYQDGCVLPVGGHQHETLPMEHHPRFCIKGASCGSRCSVLRECMSGAEKGGDT